ncbi:MAG: 50S ribosomal protein L1, partial [Methanoregula sp.]|nr:50S ribosomal protein L1 [Methanoregula sp.]
MVDRAKILQAVNTAIEKAPERKFSESIDITINLKNIDMAQPKNRIDETIL